MHSKTDDMIPYQCCKILYNNIQHDNKKLITIKGKHSSPILHKDILSDLFNFCDISCDLNDSKEVNCILKNLETVAQRNNNFIYR